MNKFIFIFLVITIIILSTVGVYFFIQKFYSFKTFLISLRNVNNVTKSVDVFLNDIKIKNLLRGDDSNIFVKNGDILSSTSNSKNVVKYKIYATLLKKPQSFYIYDTGIYSDEENAIVKITNSANDDYYIYTSSNIPYPLSNAKIEQGKNVSVYMHLGQVFTFGTNSDSSKYSYIFTLTKTNINHITITESGLSVV